MKPTLGYPSRTQAVRALIAQGLNEQQIADKIGISKNNVQCLQYDLGKVRHRRDGRGPRSTVHICTDDLDHLKPQADRRGIHVAELVRRLIYTIAEEGLVDSVLDDGTDAAAGAGRHPEPPAKSAYPKRQLESA